MAVNWETCPVCYGGDVNCPDNCESAPLLGPQPSSFRCCPSCLILARAVARLAYHLGYDETGDELTDMLGEEEINTEAVNQ